MSRKIKVFNTLQGISTETVDATTKAELVAILTAKGILTSDMKMIIKEEGRELLNDSDVLPTGLGRDENGDLADYDFTLFLSATKTKSGN